MQNKLISSELFSQNRTNFLDKMLTDSVAVFWGNFVYPKSADMYFAYKQDADLYYLSGILDEKAVLVLWKNSIGETKEILFIADFDEEKALWDGIEPSDDVAKEISGIEKVLPVSEFEKVFRRIVTEVGGIYLNLNEHNRFLGEVKTKNQVMAEKLKQEYPAHTFYRSAPLLAELRVKKSSLEIEVMQKACQITGDTFENICMYLKSGVMEYEIEAEIIANFRRSGATGPAYDSIVASGKKNCVLHYRDNNQVCKDGDLLLLDFGCEYSGYASDLSRTIPVSGKYSYRQADVYDSVLRVLQQAKKMLKEGVVLNNYHIEVGKIMTEELIKLGLIDKNEAKKTGGDQLYRKYFMHGTSHYIGLDTHDVGRYDLPLPAGAVVTVEPGIYIPEEGFGIRLENNVVIQNSGRPVLDLMGLIPIKRADIEDLMH